MSPEDDVVDPALLSRAAQVLGTSGASATIDRALSLAIQHGNREQAVAAELLRYASGYYTPLAAPAGQE